VTLLIGALIAGCAFVLGVRVGIFFGERASARRLLK
jgi:hypothetical protein